jgi:hypothetical protein
MDQLTFDIPPDNSPAAYVSDLRRWCDLANRIAYETLGYRNSCVLTSHALAAFLREQGIDAEPFRAEMHAFPDDGLDAGFVLGSSGDGTRRPAASPGGWWGHLAVSCGEWVLDPTIDQSAVGYRRLRPAVFRKPSGWDEGVAHCWNENGIDVRYQRYYRQVGWKSAPDARPSHWLDVVLKMQIATLEAELAAQEAERS